LLKKIALGRGSVAIIIFIILTISSALFYKESIGTGFNKEYNVTLNQIIERKELRVGMLRSLTTLYIDYRNPNQAGGFEYELLKKFADSLNVKLKITFANNLTELVERSKQGKIDLIAAELKGYVSDINNFNASDPFHRTTLQLIYRKGSIKPYSFNDIKGDLTVAKNSLQSYILRNTKNNFPQLNWHESAILNQEELLKLVEDKDIDYTIASSQTTSIMRRIYPSLTVAFDVVNNQPKTWYLPKSLDKSLLNNINQFIEKSRNNLV